MVLTFVCILYGMFLVELKKQQIAISKYKVYSDHPRTEDSLIQDAVSSVSSGKFEHPINDVLFTRDVCLWGRGSHFQHLL